MTSEHWREVWQLCEAARQLPREKQTDYVWSNATDGDAAREALSLLAEPETSVLPSWSSDPGSEGSSSGSAVRSAPSLAGMRVGRYAVNDLIGCGASGDVYSALDVELERSVALKFLRCGSAESGWRVEWFLREARAASALNHPGIVTVHEVMQSEAGLAIVMELVEGKAFRELCGSPNSIEAVTRWGAQVAEALSAAHSCNIIHRDIKPENIMLRADGLAKVLDFGLAQWRGGLQDSRVSQARVGTLRYMSPEQAAGEELTPATDIFSFGVVLYELTTGRHPFPATSIESVLESLFTCRPDPLSRWRRDVPKPLETLILEMLSKAPEARPKAQEIARRLEGLSHPSPVRRGRLWMIAALAIVASAWGVAWIIQPGSANAPPVALAAVPLTTTAGFDSWPDISPDGNTVVYGWGQSPDAFTHIYLKDLDQDARVQLVEADPGSRIGRPKWSSDGQRIFYKSTSPRQGAESIWSVARDGSDPRLIVRLATAELSSGIDASRDGKRIVFGDTEIPGKYPFSIYSLDLASGEKKRLTEPQDGWGDWDPHYSPDGKQIALKRVKRPSDDQLYLMPASGGPLTRIPLPRQSIYGHAWKPDGELLLAAQLGSVIHGLWTISATGRGEATPVFEAGVDATMPAVNGNRTVWVNQAKDYNIYSVPLAGGKPVKRIASPVLDSKPALAPDGRVAFVSRRSGSPELWITGTDGTNAVRVTSLKGDVGRPYWSYDGTRIVFSIERFGASKIYLVRCTPGTLRCGAPEPLVAGANPTWSPSGEFIYFNTPDHSQIWKLSLSGGQPVKVAPGLEALTSHDGRWLYIATAPTGRFLRIALDKDGSTTTEQLIIPRGGNSAGPEHWTLAGDEILFWDSNIESRSSGLLAYHTVTKRLRTVVETPTAEFPAVSADGKTVWYAQPDSAGGTLMVGERRQ